MKDSPLIPTVGMASVTSMKRSIGLQRKRKLHRHRIDMMTVDDQAAPAVHIFQRCADGARFTPGQRRHRIEQMSEAAQPASIAARICE